MMESVVVHRSGWKMWGLALLGVPLVVIGVDVIYRRRITDAFRELLFRPEDTQLFEARDVIWGVALLVLGLVLTLWGLRELIAPPALVSTDEEGIRLKLGPPWRPGTLVPWSELEDLGAATVDDEGDVLPVFWVKTRHTGVLPERPWGARWVGARTLAVLSTDWEMAADRVAEGIAAYAVDLDSEQGAQPPHRVSGEEDEPGVEIEPEPSP